MRAPNPRHQGRREGSLRDVRIEPPQGELPRWMRCKCSADLDCPEMYLKFLQNFICVWCGSEAYAENSCGTQLFCCLVETSSAHLFRGLAGDKDFKAILSRRCHVGRPIRQLHNQAPGEITPRWLASDFSLEQNWQKIILVGCLESVQSRNILGPQLYLGDSPRISGPSFLTLG